MPYIYCLISTGLRRNISYVGWTVDLNKRLKLHNSNKGAKFTRGKFWELIYFEKCKSKKDAMRKEYILKKNYNLRKKLKRNFINSKK